MPRGEEGLQLPVAGRAASKRAETVDRTVAAVHCTLDRPHPPWHIPRTDLFPGRWRRPDGAVLPQIPERGLRQLLAQWPLPGKRNGLSLAKSRHETVSGEHPAGCACRSNVERVSDTRFLFDSSDRLAGPLSKIQYAFGPGFINWNGGDFPNANTHLAYVTANAKRGQDTIQVDTLQGLEVGKVGLAEGFGQRCCLVRSTGLAKDPCRALDEPG